MNNLSKKDYIWKIKNSTQPQLLKTKTIFSYLLNYKTTKFWKMKILCNPDYKKLGTTGLILCGSPSRPKAIIESSLWLVKIRRSTQINKKIINTLTIIIIKMKRGG